MYLPSVSIQRSRSLIVHDLLISRSQRTLIERHASACLPEESCGLLLGAQEGPIRVIRQVVAAANVFEGDRKRHFVLDPSVLARVLHRRRAHGSELLGVFHSHPESAPFPSKKDEESAWHELSYLILGSTSGDSWTAKSWRWFGAGRGFAEESLRVAGGLKAP